MRIRLKQFGLLRYGILFLVQRRSEANEQLRPALKEMDRNTDDDPAVFPLRKARRDERLQHSETILLTSEEEDNEILEPAVKKAKQVRISWMI